MRTAERISWCEWLVVDGGWWVVVFAVVFRIQAPRCQNGSFAIHFVSVFFAWATHQKNGGFTAPVCGLDFKPARAGLAPSVPD